MLSIGYHALHECNAIPNRTELRPIPIPSLPVGPITIRSYRAQELLGSLPSHPVGRTRRPSLASSPPTPPGTYRIQCSARVHARTLPSRESTAGVSGASNAVPIHRGPIPPSGPDFREGAVFGQSLGATGATTSGTRTKQKEKCNANRELLSASGLERTPRGMIVIESTWRRGRAQWSTPHR